MNLTLYYLPGCPYCIKVQRAAQRLGIEMDLRDIARDREARADLIAGRGRATVPVLRVEADGRAELIGESDAIVTFLEAAAEVRETAA